LFAPGSSMDHKRRAPGAPTHSRSTLRASSRGAAPDGPALRVHELVQRREVERRAEIRIRAPRRGLCGEGSSRAEYDQAAVRTEPFLLAGGGKAPAVQDRHHQIQQNDIRALAAELL